MTLKSHQHSAVQRLYTSLLCSPCSFSLSFSSVSSLPSKTRCIRHLCHRSFRSSSLSSPSSSSFSSSSSSSTVILPTRRYFSASTTTNTQKSSRHERYREMDYWLKLEAPPTWRFANVRKFFELAQIGIPEKGIIFATDTYGKKTGVIFVHMKNEFHLRQALDLDGKRFLTDFVRVSRTSKEEYRTYTLGGQLAVDAKTPFKEACVFEGRGLPFWCHDGILREYFKFDYKQCVMHVDEKGRPLGSCYLEFEDEGDSNVLFKRNYSLQKWYRDYVNKNTDCIKREIRFEQARSVFYKAAYARLEQIKNWTCVQLKLPKKAQERDILMFFEQPDLDFSLTPNAIHIHPGAHEAYVEFSTPKEAYLAMFLNQQKMHWLPGDSGVSNIHLTRTPYEKVADEVGLRPKPA